MNKIFKFGEDVNGYAIPVLNERETRADAGLLSLMMVSTTIIASVTSNCVPLKFKDDYRISSGKGVERSGHCAESSYRNIISPAAGVTVFCGILFPGIHGFATGVPSLIPN